MNASQGQSPGTRGENLGSGSAGDQRSSFYERAARRLTERYRQPGGYSGSGQEQGQGGGFGQGGYGSYGSQGGFRQQGSGGGGQSTSWGNESYGNRGRGGRSITEDATSRMDDEGGGSRPREDREDYRGRQGQPGGEWGTHQGREQSWSAYGAGTQQGQGQAYGQQGQQSYGLGGGYSSYGQGQSQGYGQGQSYGQGQDFDRDRDRDRNQRGRWQREAITAGEIMTTNVKFVSREATAQQIAAYMKDENCGVIPVVDDNRKLIGVVTDRDLVIRATAEGKAPNDCRAEDVMTDDVEAVTPDEEIKDVIEVMGKKQVRRVPVVDRNDRLLGIISMGDIANRADYDEELQEALEKVSSKRSFWSRLWT
jgi:CBS domain-containing protein